jgi:hypothetical protein
MTWLATSRWRPGPPPIRGRALPAAEARAGADRAVATLRRAVAAGYPEVAPMRLDSHLDPFGGSGGSVPGARRRAWRG